MANEIRAYSFTIPAGTPITSPASMSVSFPPRDVEAIQVVIPPGPNGFVGFQLQNSGVAVIPYASDDYIVASDEVINWPLAGYINSGSWQLAGYNTGTSPHTIYVRFLLNYLTPANEGLTPAGVLTNDSLSNTASDVPAQTG